MYRFVMFISCLYGGKAESFQIPSDISAMFFTMTYEGENRLATDLLEAIPNHFVNAIFVYDREMCILNVHKGDGDLDTVVADHEADMLMQYELGFEGAFEYIDIVDQRRNLFISEN